MTASNKAAMFMTASSGAHSRRPLAPRNDDVDGFLDSNVKKPERI